MHKHIIAKLERGSNLRKSIRGEREIFNAALSNVEFPATNIPYSPAMYSDILFDSPSSVGNASASSKEDNINDVMDDSSSMRVNKEDNGKERENLVVTERLNDEASEEENDKTLSFPEQLMNLLSEKYDINHDQKIIQKVINVLDKTQASAETTDISTTLSPDVLVRNQIIYPETIVSFDKTHASIDITDKEITPLPRSYGKALKVANSFHTTQASLDTTDMEITYTSNFIARNHMLPEHNENIHEKMIDRSFVRHKTQDPIDASGIVITPLKDRSICSERNRKIKETMKYFDTDFNFIPSPRHFAKKRSSCSELNEKKRKSIISFDRARASVDTIDMDITPSRELFDRKQSNLMKLMELKEQQKEIDGLLQDIIQGASK